MEKKCPYCGEGEFVEARQEGYASLTPVGKIFTLKQQALYHILCTNCGRVVESYVKNPKKLVTEESKVKSS